MWVGFLALALLQIQNIEDDTVGCEVLDAKFSSIVEASPDNSVVAIVGAKKQDPSKALSRLVSRILICRETGEGLEVTHELITGLPEIRSAAFSTNGERFAASDNAGRIIVWRTKDFLKVRTIRAQQKLIPEIEFLPAGTLVSCLVDSSVEPLEARITIWDLATGNRSADRRVPDVSRFVSLSVSPGGKFLATGDTSGRTRVWDSALLGEITQFEHDNWLASVKFSPSGKYLASADQDGKILVICTDKWERWCTFEGHAECGIRDMLFFGDDLLLSVGGEERRSEMFLWGISDKKMLKRFQAGGWELVSCAAWSENRVLVVSLDGRVYCFKMPQVPKKKGD